MQPRLPGTSSEYRRCCSWRPRRPSPRCATATRHGARSPARTRPRLTTDPSPRGGRTPPDLEPALVKTPIKATFATVAVVIVLVDRLAAPDPAGAAGAPVLG